MLEERGVEFRIIDYLKEPPSRETLAELISLLPNEPAEIVRKDKRFAELGLDATDYVSVDQVLDLLTAHPELMQRPIAVKGGVAVIGRPADKVLEVL